MAADGVILIVDDNKSVLGSISLFLKHKVRRVITCSNPNLIPFTLEKEGVDVILLDMNFTAGTSNGNEGLFWIKEIIKKDPQIVIIPITAYGEVELAVNAMKVGATDFILKPWDNQKLLATIKSGLALRKTRKELVTLKQQKQQLLQDINHHYEEFLGKSSAIQEVFKTIGKVAKTDANVLILGENGTGKELAAREIHRLSERSQKIFLSVDLGALSETLFESELFGHVKGAFTDAKDDRTGRFQTASGGTLFLDEIGNLSPKMQTKLLSVLQNREVAPLGASKPIPIDVRLICATNRDLAEMVKQGLFREDLLYRINTIQVNLPPLRERSNDVELLANHFLKKYTDKYEKHGLSFGKSGIEKLKEYQWPGNIRELRHTIERAVILSENKILEADDFILQTQVQNVIFDDSPVSLDMAEMMIIGNSIKRNKGNLSGVARELNIGRQTLYRKIQKYNL